MALGEIVLIHYRLLLYFSLLGKRGGCFVERLMV